VSAGGLAVQLGVTPSAECPLWSAFARHDVTDLVPAGDGAPPQVLARTPAAEVPDDGPLDPVVETEDATVCALPALEHGPAPAACGHDRCLGHGFEFLPATPFDRGFPGERVRLDVAVADDASVRAALDALTVAGFEPTVERLADTADADRPRLVVVDRGALTPRQREVGRLAVERGYFSADGPGAETLAEELGIAKSTLSEHLRAVERKVGEQLFPAAAD